MEGQLPAAFCSFLRPLLLCVTLPHAVEPHFSSPPFSHSILWAQQWAWEVQMVCWTGLEEQSSLFASGLTALGLGVGVVMVMVMDV